MSKKQEPWFWQAERFFGKNWMVVLGVLTATLVFFAYEIDALRSSVESVSSKTNKVLEKSASAALVTTTDGRILEVNKIPIDAKKYEDHIKNVLLDLVVDKFTITKEMSVAPQKESDILANSIALAKFKRVYISPKDQKALDNFDGILRLLLSLQKDHLPEIIKPTAIEVREFNTNKNTFSIDLDISVNTQNYSLADGTYIPKTGKVLIHATGSFDLLDTNTENPIGLHFSYIKPVYPDKM